MIPELFTTMDWAAVGQIILIDILLGGDNAVVIALACRGLPAELQWKGIFWGTAGAVILRLILILFAVYLLQVPFLKVVAGLLLLWIGIKLLVPHEEHHEGHLQKATGLAGAIRTIIVADVVMSLDNVIAIAAAAEQSSNADHRVGLVIFGLLVSVPLIVWGSRLVLGLLDRFPVVIWFGGALLGWIAGGMVIGDRIVHTWLGPQARWIEIAAAALGALLVVAIARLLIARQRRKRDAGKLGTASAPQTPADPG